MKRSGVLVTAAAVLAAAILPLAGLAEGAGLKGAITRGAARGAKKAIPKSIQKSLDSVRDGATKPRPLPKDRSVHRYTTKERAKEEVKKGIAPGSHMTPRARPGRPPSPDSAQRRYGLPRKPEVRETISLPKGTPVRPNKALGGAPGEGELTSPRRVPPGAIKKVAPLGGARR